MCNGSPKNVIELCKALICRDLRLFFSVSFVCECVIALPKKVVFHK